MILTTEVKAWVKRKNAPDEVIRILPDLKSGSGKGRTYHLYRAFDIDPDYLGRILFDAQDFWIYDGEVLRVDEQEQVAKFIINYVETSS